MLKNFSNELFPVTLAYAVSGGAEFKTIIHEGENGLESRMQMRTTPVFRYYISHEMMSASEMELFSNFFISHRGKAIAFRFHDASDNFANCAQQVINGRGQLHKEYVVGGQVVRRKIMLPYNCKFFVDGAQVDAEVNEQTGEFILLDCPEDAVITASFNFDVPVRFDVDSLIIDNLYKSKMEFGFVQVIG